jgi:hypothetical protein
MFSGFFADLSLIGIPWGGWMTLEEMFAMNNDQFNQAISEMSKTREEKPFNDDDNFETQLSDFGVFKQSDEGIKSLIEASRKFD